MTTPPTLSTGPAAYPKAFTLPAPLVLTGPAERAVRRSQSAVVSSPQRYTQVLLVAMALGSTFRNYWINSHNEHQDPSVWMSFVNGTGLAPEQYRVGVKMAAWWLMRHVGGGFRHSFALMDVVGCTLAGLLLYALLQRSRVYRQARTSLQWMGSTAFLALFFYYLSWLPWFEKAETLPSVGLVAALLWMWSPRERVQGGSGRGAAQAGTVCGLLLLTLAQASVRADIALTLSLGMMLVSIHRRSAVGCLALPRKAAAATAGACAMIAAGTQAYMMRVAYPHATYGGTPVFMLRHDFADPLVAGPFALFLLPYGWSVYAAYAAPRTWRTPGVYGVDAAESGDAAPFGLLLGSLLYLPLWVVLGKLDEVRIFLPFALALVPLTTGLLLARAYQDGAPEVRQDALCAGDAR